MDQKKWLHELAHLYADGALNRRELVKRAREFAGGVAVVSAALNAMGVPLQAQSCPEDVKVAADDPAISGQDVEYPGEGETGKMLGYLVKPVREEATDPLPAVIVIHENRGLVEHIRDVTRRVAKAGYIALGVDLLSRQGGSAQFTEPQQQTQAYGRTLPAERLADLKSSVAYLKSLPEVRGNRIGSVGFCAGGANVWALAASGEDVAASVVYYGAAAPADQIANIKGPILCHYGQRDRNTTSPASAAIANLLTQNRVFGFFVWEDAAHAFNNDTGAAYNRTVACAAWEKTLDFYNRHLNKPDDPPAE